MPRKPRMTSTERIELYRLLMKAGKKSPVWRRVAEELRGPRRRQRAVNILRLARSTQSGDVAVVPGKLLGRGTMDHEVTVSAFSFSELALKKIRTAGGKPLGIKEMVKLNPSGRGLKIIG